MNRVRIKLTKIPEKLSKKGGYRARVLDNGVVDFDEFTQEVVNNCGFRMEPRTLRMYLEATMETMISGVLSDGRTRRMGDYFSLGLKVGGRFEEQGDEFDEDLNELKLKLKPLKELKNRSFKKLSVYTENNGPKIKLTSLASVSTPDSPWVNFGEDFVVKGENLALSKDAEICVYVTGQMGGGHTSSGLASWEYEASTGMIRFKWDKIFSPGRDWIKGLACQLMIVVKTRGRIPDANMQKRSIRTFFKEYHDKYPNEDINKYSRPK